LPTYSISRVLQLSILSASLGADKIHFSDIDFLSLPPPTLPYIIQDNGYVLRRRAARMSRTQCPKDVSMYKLFSCTLLISPQRQYIDASMQTDDPDCTLTEIDPDVLTEDRNIFDGELNIKKRKRM
jgi:hypothetical protein